MFVEHTMDLLRSLDTHAEKYKGLQISRTRKKLISIAQNTWNQEAVHFKLTSKWDNWKKEDRSAAYSFKNFKRCK